MKHKVRELQDALLDAAVAKAVGWSWRIISEQDSPTGAELMMAHDGRHENPRHFSRDWEDGGPVIEHEHIDLIYVGGETWGARIKFRGAYEVGNPHHHGSGPTPLIAAMRAYVAMKFGQEVELP